MAKTWFALGMGLFLLAGCQQRMAVVDPLPNPTFDPPSVLPQQKAPQQVVVRNVKPPEPVKPPQPQPGPLAGIPQAWLAPKGVPARGWQFIVIHHSDTPAGGAMAFDKFHRQVRGWDELGYHFVIGNGTDTADGAVEVGSRWPKQKQGAHTKTPDNRFNDFGIGICLVGNFDHDRPTAAQMRSLVKLVAHLERTYKIPTDRVIGHKDAKSTDCPGRFMSVADVRRQAAALAGAAPAQDATRTASADLLREAHGTK